MNDYTILEMIEMAKKSEYGAVWYSEKGPIQITKDGDLIPLKNSSDSNLSREWKMYFIPMGSDVYI